MDDVWSEYAMWKRITDARPYARGDSAERRAADCAARNLAFGLAIVAAYHAAVTSPFIPKWVAFSGAKR